MAFTDLIPWHRGGMSPFRAEPVSTLQREINRMFEDFWNTGGRVAGEAMGTLFPEIDIAESENFVDLTAEIPGLSEKEINLSLADDGETLILEGEKKTETEGRSEGIYRSERRYGKFRRAVALPCRVDEKNVDATCKDGVLTVHMKKLADQGQHVKQIPIKTS